jgi:trimeric autotransporter adhesin
VPTFTGLQPGVASNILLQKGQIYAVLGDIVGDGPDGYELTGTKIRSLSAGRPIAVFSGSSRTSNPASCGSGGGDNDMVQVFPLHLWGNNYLTAPLPSSSSASFASTNTFKVMVNDPQTVVSRNGVVLTGLVNNSYYKYESNTADYIRADKPIMMAQFMSGGGCTQGLGDPEMFYLSPIESGIKKATCVRTNREGISINYALVIVPTAGISSLLIDGSATFNHSYAHPNIPGYSVVVKSWTSAISQFTVQSDSAFTGLSFGIGPVESYGHNLGAIFKANNGLDPMVPMRWTGVSNTDWFSPGNWSTTKIPTADDHIVIPAGSPFSPSIPAGQTARCKSITVEPGASVNVGVDAKLDITKN